MINLEYKNKKVINSKNYKDLNEIQLQQLAICASLSFGEAYSTAEDFLEQTGNGNIQEGYAELFDIAERGNQRKVLYQAWFYQFNNANVFFVGTTNNIGFGMREGFFKTQDENCEILCADLQKAYYSRDASSYQTAKKIMCPHLQPLEAYLKSLNIPETFRGQPWSNNCREWVYFDCILQAPQLNKRFHLGDTVSVWDYENVKVGSELGLVCDECKDGIMGAHPNSVHSKNCKRIQ